MKLLGQDFRGLKCLCRPKTFNQRCLKIKPTIFFLPVFTSSSSLSLLAAFGGDAATGGAEAFLGGAGCLATGAAAAGPGAFLTGMMLTLGSLGGCCCCSDLVVGALASPAEALVGILSLNSEWLELLELLLLGEISTVSETISIAMSDLPFRDDEPNSVLPNLKKKIFGQQFIFMSN